MKKAFSILAVTAIISSSVVAPFNMYVPNIEAAEGINPANLIDNPNLISSDITIDPNDKYRLLSWNNINGYGALKVEGTYAISQGARTYKIHNNHSIELDFMSLNNDTLSQTIDTEIGKEYTFSLKFSVPQYMDRTITMRAGNASRTAFTSSEGTRTATRTLNFTATDTKTKIYIGISGTAATRHVMYFSELSVTKSDKQVTADIKAVLDVAEASVKGLFNNGDVKGTIKDTTNQVAIDSARVLVNAVTDQTKKTELENNLKEAQKQLDARNAAVAEKSTSRSSRSKYQRTIQQRRCQRNN
ncbi:toxin Cry1Ac domain D-VI-related protein [Listeria rocourtiae]|uniref:toxin Cry1Ac domain D-VI-related protein n=1 Tax=Listeria rocourtiae TaxID=647910 RepID=UPI0003E89BBB|nr:toxin Cry1Ac domain D-VI-related protein [Listeria rocourtiae]EUJ48370.1 hypothetical protein PROCOU_05468 [Listeria rocourtiae FSL F6-920]